MFGIFVIRKVDIHHDSCTQIWIAFSGFSIQAITDSLHGRMPPRTRDSSPYRESTVVRKITMAMLTAGDVSPTTLATERLTQEQGENHHGNHCQALRC